MPILNRSQYEKIKQNNRAELDAIKRQEKIRVLAQYFNQSDALVNLVDRIPDSAFKDSITLINELAKLDRTAQLFGYELQPAMNTGMNTLAFTGSQHTIDKLKAGGYSKNINQMKIVDKSVSKLEIPFQRDLDILVDSGIYESRSFSKLSSGGIVQGGFDRYNRMLEKTLLLEDDFERNRNLQALSNYVNSSDPLGSTVRTIARSYNIKPQVTFSLSNSIWGKDSRDKIYSYIINGSNAGLGKSVLIQGLEAFLKNTGQDNAYLKAERAIDTELQRAYTTAHLETVREANQGKGPKLMIKQSVSGTHKGTDICDELAGTYDPGGAVPIIPRHPWCTCEEEDVFIFDVKGKDVKTFTKEDVRNYEYKSKNYPAQTIPLNLPTKASAQLFLDVSSDFRSIGVNANQFNENEIRYMDERGVKVVQDKMEDLGGVYSPFAKKITIDSSLPAEVKNYVAFHEFGHVLDEKLGFTTYQGSFDKLTYSTNGIPTTEALNVLKKRLDPKNNFDYKNFEELVLFGEGKIRDGTLMSMDVLSVNEFNNLSELSAEAYALYRTDPQFGAYAPNYNNYFNSIKNLI